MKQLSEMYTERKQFPLLKMNEMKKQQDYFDLYMANKHTEDMLLCGMFANLYGGTMDY
jgi:hypothetical protein